MMIRFTALTLVATLTSAGAASAVTVNLTGLDTNNQFNANGSSFSTAVVPLGAASATHLFTVTGLDIAEDGSADDTVVFSYDVTATGGVVANISANAFSYGVDGDSDPGDNEIDPSETLSFGNLTATATFGTDPGLVLQVDSAGFTSVTTRFPGGGDNPTIETSSPDETITTDGGSSFLVNFDAPVEGFSASSAGGNGYGLDSITATFELSAVPEPSSLALLGLGGLLIARRRKG